MNLAKKAVSLGTSAALVASLLATVVAPAAFAAGSVVSSGSTVVGHTSAAPFTLTLTENNVGDLSGTGTIIVTLPNNVAFSGTPSVSSGSSSIGIASSVVSTTTTASDTLTITTNTAGNSSFLDTLVISSKIAVGATVPAGAITATVTGSISGAFLGTQTATGSLVNPSALPGTGVWLNAPNCAFTTGAATVGGVAYTISNIVSGQSNGLEQVDFTTGTAANYAALTAVAQTSSSCGISTFTVGTAVNGLAYAAASQPGMSADTNNNEAGDLTITESNAGTLAAGSTLNFTILTPGVTLSGTKPTASWTTGNGTFVSNTATVDTTTWRTFSFTVNAASSATTGDVITVTNLNYDLAASVPAGTQIMVGMTNSGSVPQDNASVSNAIVGNQIAAVAATPTVFIGYNSQNTGMITLTEKAAGYFTASTGNNNEFWVCSPENYETITTAPWAVVVSPVAGSLTLVSPTTGLPVSVAKATQVATDHFGNPCWGWSVYAASTVASTVEILGTNATDTAPLAAAPGNGMQINVPTGSTPGPVYLDVRTGQPYGTVTSQLLTIAYRAFKNQLTISATSAPWMMPGTINNPAGNLVLTETQTGQLSAGNNICVDVHDGDVDFGALNTSAQPLAVADTNVSGLIVGPVTFSGYDCSGHWQGRSNLGAPLGPGEPGYFAPSAYSFHFPIVQGSTSAHGTVTISNIKYNVYNDATLGIVALNVYISDGALQDSQGFVTNAHIGSAPKLNIGAYSALGLKPTTGYTTATPKVTKVGKFVTWKFTGGTALAGQRVNILVATKVNGAWGGPKYYVSRVADANGIVTFWWTSKTAAAVNVRVQWPGSATYGVSTSKALGAYFQ